MIFLVVLPKRENRFTVEFWESFFESVLHFGITIKNRQLYSSPCVSKLTRVEIVDGSTGIKVFFGLKTVVNSKKSKSTRNTKYDVHYQETKFQKCDLSL